MRQNVKTFNNSQPDKKLFRKMFDRRCFISLSEQQQPELVSSAVNSTQQQLRPHLDPGFHHRKTSSQFGCQLPQEKKKRRFCQTNMDRYQINPSDIRAANAAGRLELDPGSGVNLSLILGIISWMQITLETREKE